MNEGNGAVLFRDGTQNREADGMIASDANTTHAGFENWSNSLLDALKSILDGKRIYREIAKIGDAMLREGIHVENRVPRADDCGLNTHIPRAEARTRPVGGAAIKRHTDNRHFQLFRVRDMRQTHERRNAGKAGIAECVEGLGMRQAKNASGFRHGEAY